MTMPFAKYVIDAGFFISFSNIINHPHNKANHYNAIQTNHGFSFAHKQLDNDLLLS